MTGRLKPSPFPLMLPRPIWSFFFKSVIILGSVGARLWDEAADVVMCYQVKFGGSASKDTHIKDPKIGDRWGPAPWPSWSGGDDDP